MDNRVKNIMSVLIKLYPIIPIVLLIVTVCLIVNSKNKLERYHECVGTIVGFYENTAETRLNSYESKAISPVVSYSVDGVSYEFIGKYYSTTMQEGNKVSVMYNKNDPSKAAIKTGLFLAPLITGALTLLFVLPIVIYIVLKSKGLVNF